MAAVASKASVALAGSVRPNVPAARCLGAPLRVNSARRAVSARAESSNAAQEVGKALSLTAAASSLFIADHAHAATELAQVAVSDNRISTIALLFAPALGWVGFNMLQPALNQLARQNEIATASKGNVRGAKAARRGVVGAVGMGAAMSMLAAQQADAATEIAQMAATDNRISTIALLFAPALGWVAFNMLQPALNQLARQNEIIQESKGNVRRSAKAARRGVVGAVGMGAAMSMFAAQQADAATEIAQMAATDNRIGYIFLLFVPALGWVAFNILQPALNQLARQSEIIQESKSSGKSSGKPKRR
eukprot:jgi/Chrzof1/6205/Cz17g15140.t1_PSBY[v5.2]